MLRRVIASAVCAALLATAGLAAALPAGAATKKPRVTFIGDSVSASLLYVPSAVKLAKKGLDLRLDLRVCRRLVAPSCSYMGSTPSTALEAITAGGSGLGRTVIIDVGYNDASGTYNGDIQDIMAALKKAGVTSVIWVTLAEKRSDYVTTNGIIRAAAKRNPKRMCVADWAKASSGKPYFGGDGLHLNTAGATALAKLIRPFALRAGATGSCAPAS